MDPITALIDKTEEIIGHSPHPAIVTVPIGAWTVSNVADALAFVTGNERFDDVARVSMAVGLVGAVGAAATGLRDYGRIPQHRPSHKIATTHGLGNALVSSLFVASYIMRTRDQQAGRPTRPLARILGLAGGGLVLYTAWLGGKLVEEYGEGVKPVMDRMSHDESDHSQGRERLHPETPLGLPREFMKG